MSHLGQKRTLKRLQPMSAITPKADIAGRDLDVRFVPLGDISQISLLNRSKKRTTASDWRTLTVRPE